MSRGRTRTPGALALPVPRRPACLLLLPALLVLAGCLGERNVSDEPDPLVGGPPIPRRGPLPAGPAGAQAGGLPPMPPKTELTSPAALASGPPQPQDTGEPLRITGGTPVSLPGGPPGAAGGWPPAPPPPSGPVQLCSPEPIDPSARLTPVAAGSPGVTLTGGPTPVPAVPAMSADSYDELQKQLAARGVTWQRLETVGDHGEWKFSCALPSPGNPRTRQVYESPPVASAGAAIRAVLERIDLDHH